MSPVHAPSRPRTGWDLPLEDRRSAEDAVALPPCTSEDPSAVPLRHPAVRAHLAAQLRASGHNPDDYLPAGPSVPDDGGWALVVDTLGLRRYADQLLGGFAVPTLSLWFAVPWQHTDRRLPRARVVLPYDERWTETRDRRMTRWLTARLVEIVTPGGPAVLWPREHQALTPAETAALLAAPTMRVHPLRDWTQDAPLGIDPDRMFYLRSRGIGWETAVRLLLHEVRRPDVAWAAIDSAEPAGT